MENETQQNHNNIIPILKELSDIKVSVGITTTKTSGIEDSLRKIETTLTSMTGQLGSHDGKIIRFEGWSVDATKILDSVAKTSLDYQVNKTRLWTALIVGGVFIGTIISLCVYIINSKIDRVDQKADSALFNKNNVKSVEELNE